MKFLKYLVIFLIVISISFLGVGLFNPTITYESSVVVNRRIGYSFNVYTNPFYLNKWVPGFKGVKPISGMPYQVGSVYELTMEDNGEEIVMEQIMTGFETNKLIAFKLSNDVLVSEVTTTFEEVDGKTKITSVTVVTGNNIVFRSMFPFMKSDFQEREQAGYDKLKKLIEGTLDQSNLLLDLFFKKG